MVLGSYPDPANGTSNTRIWYPVENVYPVAPYLRTFQKLSYTIIQLNLYQSLFLP